MSVLVTGASGFVGAHLVGALAAAGLGAVIAADLAPPPGEAGALPSVMRIALDVTDAAAVSAAFAEWRPALVVHAAAVTPSLEEEGRDAALIMAVNAGGAANVAAAALAEGGVGRLVLFSSSAVYNGLSAYPDQLGETQPLPERPASLYAVTKFACEGLAHRLVAAGLSACALRVTSVYGERERPTGSRKAPRMSLMHRLAEACARGEPVRIEGDAARREWVHGDDVAAAAAALLAAPALNHVVYNVGSGVATRFDALVRLFEAEGLTITGDAAAPLCRMSPAEDRPPLDIRRIEEDVRWRPRVALADGVRALVRHHRQAPERRP